MKKFVSIIICIALILTLSSCTVTNNKKYSKTAFDLFDTVITVTAYDECQSAFDEHFNAFCEVVKEYDNLYDIYNTYDGLNNLKTINDNAGIAPVEVDRRIIDLLNFGVEVYAKTDGRVNICMGSVLSIWHEYREADENTLPGFEELNAANAHCSIDSLKITESTVYLSDSYASLDVGAIAKGYAAQKLAYYAEQNLWESAVISLGGNVVTYGTKNGESWNIAIDNPNENADSYLHTLSVTDKSVVTSADTQRYYTVDGKRYCHIINPETLYPSEYMHSVTVVCNDSALADALSTALFNMPLDEGKDMIENTDGVEALFVDMEYNEMLEDLANDQHVIEKTLKKLILLFLLQYLRLQG